MKVFPLRWLWFLLLTAGLSACAVQTPTLTPTPPPSYTSTIQPATATPSPTQTRRPTRTPTASITPSPTLTPIPARATLAPAGLLYLDRVGIWLTENNGQSRLLITDTRALIAPNLQFALTRHCDCEGYHVVDLATGERLYTLDNVEWAEWSYDSQSVYYQTQHLSDIEVLNLKTEQRKNLTNTPKRQETLPNEWPTHPETLIFTSWPSDETGGEGFIGQLTVMQANGQNYRIVDQKYLADIAVASPDGRILVYTTHETAHVGDNSEHSYITPWIYDRNKGVRPFPLSKFGFEDISALSFAAPTWSPSGKQLAFWMGQRNYASEEYQYQDGIGIMNLTNSSYKFLSQFEQSYYSHSITWSPDEQWVVFYAVVDGFDNEGLWLARTDGQQTYHIITSYIGYDTCTRIFSNDSLWLVFTCNDDTLSGLWLWSVASHQLFRTTISTSVELLDWITP